METKNKIEEGSVIGYAPFCGAYGVVEKMIGKKAIVRKCCGHINALKKYGTIYIEDLGAKHSLLRYDDGSIGIEYHNQNKEE